ncbi:hypothetical protein DYI22_16840, partial [Marinobacter lipolyticus]|uniref:hypothetical protein n=1 Tax=Marinobacter lipolyticus TaxID=209639 RepID=UPI001BCF88BA
YALVTGLSNEEPAIIELLHEGPQRPLGVGLNLPKHGRNYPYKSFKFVRITECLLFVDRTSNRDDEMGRNSLVGYPRCRTSRD